MNWELDYSLTSQTLNVSDAAGGYYSAVGLDLRLSSLWIGSWTMVLAHSQILLVNMFDT